MQWSPGGQLGRFELERRLGAGAFAEVWLASEKGALGFSRRVALKQLRASRDEARHRDDLLREARLCAHLCHPNVISVLAVEEDDDGLVVVMEYLDGGSLGDLLDFAAERGLRLPRSVVIDLASQLATGLQYAHEALGEDDRPMGLVHRDLKPANVLLGRSGVAKISDFGIAKGKADTTTTATGALKGTVAYVAPEILSGVRSFAPCVDLFALGCILYELVLVERLFKSDVPATVMFKIVSGDPHVEVEGVRAAFPELAGVLEGLLQRAPDRRTPSAAVLLAALQPLAAIAPSGGDAGHLIDIRRLCSGAASGKGLRIPRPADADWRAWMELAARHDPQYADALSAPTPAEVKPPSPPVVRRPPDPETLRPPDRARRPTRPRSMLSRTRPQRPVAPRWLGPAAVLLLLLVLAAVAVVFTRGPASRDASSTGPGEQPLSAELPPDLPAVASRSEARERPASAAPESSRPSSAGSTRPARGEEAAPPAPAEAPAPSDEPAASEEPAERIEEAPPAPREAAPTPAPSRTTSAASSEACLILTSRPGGGRVWLDGRSHGIRASSKTSSQLSRKPGRVTVGMGMNGETVSTSVRLRAGQASQVSCDLLGTGGCTVQALPSSACE